MGPGDCRRFLNPLRIHLAIRQGESSPENPVKNFLKEIAALKFTPWYRWHPNIALRYLPVAKYIKNYQSHPKRPGLFSKGQALSTLEVGSGGLGIAPYLRMPVTGVDREFEPPFHPLLKRVKGDATDLKFSDNSFDVVISMDMLEHLPKNKRETAIREMMRVGRKTVIIGVPCGKEAEEHDREVRMMARLPRHPAYGGTPRNDETRRGFNDRGLEFLEEQVEYGLPEEIDILYYIKAAATELKKQINIEIKGNMNLRLRSFLMWGWMSGNILIDIVFRKLFLFLIPLFRMIDREPYYRKIFFVEIKRH